MKLAPLTAVTAATGIVSAGPVVQKRAVNTCAAGIVADPASPFGAQLFFHIPPDCISCGGQAIPCIGACILDGILHSYCVTCSGGVGDIIKECIQCIVDFTNNTVIPPSLPPA
ncbi:hypothetical protein VTK73DRAFT_2839 [Phialemonium thermophilum]|uniref:Uncharacterized protein n=1 Tax=Phialemonium thermophilum TaxID=223376 RepID=A0ABR3X2P6_9PEZI